MSHMENTHAPKRTASGERSKDPLVLLVEDSPELRAVFVEIFTTEGFCVVEARDGHAAVVKALAYLPAVIVMDIALPLMDGARAARVLRSNARTRSVPIVAFTGTDVDARDRKCFDVVVQKPCAPTVVLRAVRSVVARADRHRQVPH
jgi:chemosensory pili system protein ChpA (sensor histidine kinase/response regulator)